MIEDDEVHANKLGLDRIYIQANRYAPHVGVGRADVQGFVGSLVGFGATKGVFVTTSSFSAPAIDFVRHLPAAGGPDRRHTPRRADDRTWRRRSGAPKHRSEAVG